MPPAMLSAIMRAVHSPQAGASQAVVKRLSIRLPPLQVRRPCVIYKRRHDIAGVFFAYILRKLTRPPGPTHVDRLCTYAQSRFLNEGPRMSTDQQGLCSAMADAGAVGCRGGRLRHRRDAAAEPGLGGGDGRGHRRRIRTAQGRGRRHRAPAGGGRPGLPDMAGEGARHLPPAARSIRECNSILISNHRRG